MGYLSTCTPIMAQVWVNLPRSIWDPQIRTSRSKNLVHLPWHQHLSDLDSYSHTQTCWKCDDLKISRPDMDRSGRFLCGLNIDYQWMLNSNLDLKPGKDMIIIAKQSMGIGWQWNVPNTASPESGEVACRPMDIFQRMIDNDGIWTHTASEIESNMILYAHICTFTFCRYAIVQPSMTSQSTKS